MITYEQLIGQYDSEKARMDSGEEVNTLALMFIGYALDAVDTGRRNFKVELDFSEASIKEVERILDQLHKTIEKSQPSEDTIVTFAKQFAGYIGQIMILRWGGEWVEESNYPIENGPGLRIKNQDLFLLSKVYRRIINGSEENIYHFYQLIKKDIDGISEMNELKIEDLVVKEKKSFIQRIFEIRVK